jgi:hypothetical protein
MGGRVGSKCHRGQKEQEDLEKENAGMTVYLTFYFAENENKVLNVLPNTLIISIM